MDKNTWIGFILIAAIFVGFMFIQRPSKAELAERQRVQDSINLVQMAQAEAQRISDSISAATPTEEAEVATAEESKPEEQWITLQNEKLRLTLSTYGGAIQRADLLEYRASGDSINPLCLFRADESSFGFTLITINNRILHTSNLIFTPVETVEPNKAIMRLPGATEDAWLDFVYELSDDYMVHMALVPHNMQNELAQNINSLELQWRQLIPQQEQGRKFEGATRNCNTCS